MKIIKIGIFLLALQLVDRGSCFSQKPEKNQIMKINVGNEEQISALEKRITESADEFISLSLEEYELLLSQPVGTIEGFDPLTSVAGGIKVGYGFPEGSRIYKTNIQTVFPKIPNISEGEVFVFLNLVKGTNGLDYLDRQSNTEIKGDGSFEEDDFTQLTLDNRGNDTKPYWFGSRYVNLRDPADNETVRALGALGGEVKLSAVSGKVVMLLPVNITGLTLAKSDIGIEKSFAGGKITLQEITDDYISFRFTGKSENLYSWTVNNDSKEILDIDEASSKDELYKLTAHHPTSLKLFHAEIVRKEYPFSFDLKK